MILAGPRLLFHIGATFSQTVGRAERPASWLVLAALAATVWPAAALLLGHLGAAWLGHEDTATALLCAAVGFTAVVGSALVAAPALTLALHTLAQGAKSPASVEQVTPLAMGLLWPAWFTGIVLAAPPLLGLRPEVGEFAWALLATIVAVRLLSSKSVKQHLALSRRWSTGFVVRGATVFALSFVLIAVAPAMLVRGLLAHVGSAAWSGAASRTLPLPPDTLW